MIHKFKLDTSNHLEKKEAVIRSLEMVNNYAGELTIEVLPLDKIEIDPENNRDLLLTLHDALHGIDPSDADYEKKKQDWKSLESLAKTIQDGQLINPIYVYRYGNKCRLIAGERRTLASAIAGKKEIIARIAGQRPVGSKLKILQWIENNERMDLTLAERVASLEAILNAYFSEQSDAQASERLTSKLLSDLTGMSMTQSRRYLLILQGSADIKQAIAAGQLENIKLIELICGLDNAVVQQELLQAAVDGATFEAVVRLKKQLENENKVKRVTRGRKKTAVSLGTVKPTVAKMIVEALVSANALAADVVRQIQTIKDSTPWQNSELVEKAFKKIIALLR